MFFEFVLVKLEVYTQKESHNRAGTVVEVWVFYGGTFRVARSLSSRLRTRQLVRPQLEYCSCVWNPYHQTDKATRERAQRRAARFVTGDYKREWESSVTTMIHNLGWKTLEEWRAASRLTLMCKIINNLVDIDIKNTPLQLLNTQTRRSLPLTYQNLRPNKNCYKYSFFSRTIPEWNSLPVSVRTSNSLNIFKSELNKLNLLDLIAKSHYHDWSLRPNLRQIPWREIA